jgi:hypothetical protein
MLIKNVKTGVKINVVNNVALKLIQRGTYVKAVEDVVETEIIEQVEVLQENKEAILETIEYPKKKRSKKSK